MRLLATSHLTLLQQDWTMCSKRVSCCSKHVQELTQLLRGSMLLFKEKENLYFVVI